nr:MAG TPA: hypothetical protein [Caudoviricetes sp.]
MPNPLDCHALVLKALRGFQHITEFNYALHYCKGEAKVVFLPLEIERGSAEPNV